LVEVALWLLVALAFTTWEPAQDFGWSGVPQLLGFSGMVPAEDDGWA
jgi:hypothetical protein